MKLSVLMSLHAWITREIDGRAHLPLVPIQHPAREVKQKIDAVAGTHGAPILMLTTDLASLMTLFKEKYGANISQPDSSNSGSHLGGKAAVGSWIY